MGAGMLADISTASGIDVEAVVELMTAIAEQITQKTAATIIMRFM